MLDSGSATIRPSVSAAPPGANGATILTGLIGQTCACEGLIARHKRERRTTTILIISASVGERSGSIPQIKGGTSWRQDGSPGGKEESTRRVRPVISPAAHSRGGMHSHHFDPRLRACGA